MPIRAAYKPIDIHDAEQPGWPSTIPALTFHEAERAVRRLWRFGMGETPTRKAVETSGNRRAFKLYHSPGRCGVNPSRGWRELVHDLSHTMVYIENPNERPHSKFHARFEAKLIREVIRRGWLDGKLRETEPTPVPPADARRERIELKLARLEAAELRWMRKQARAERAITKIGKQHAYYTKELAKPAVALVEQAATPRAPRPPREGTWRWARAMAAQYGIDVKADGDDGYWVTCTDADQADDAPIRGNHFCTGLGEVGEAVQLYMDYLNSRAAKEAS